MVFSDERRLFEDVGSDDGRTLREILREATAADHVALDHALADFDLRTRGDLARFLAIHLAARTGVEHWLAANCATGWTPPPQTALIASDLAALGGSTEALDPPAFELSPKADWTGPAYVIAGSHLGNRLLLAQAGGALPQSARRFLTGAAMQDYWRRLRTLLSEGCGPNGSAAAIAGARATFAHFAICVERYADARLAAA